MYSSVKSTGLPLGLIGTDVFWNHSCLLVFIIPADSRLFHCTWYFAMTSLFMEVLVDSSVLVYIGDHGRFREIRSDRERD